MCSEREAVAKSVQSRRRSRLWVTSHAGPFGSTNEIGPGARAAADERRGGNALDSGREARNAEGNDRGPESAAWASSRSSGCFRRRSSRQAGWRQLGYAPRRGTSVSWSIKALTWTPELKTRGDDRVRPRVHLAVGSAHRASGSGCRSREGMETDDDAFRDRRSPSGRRPQCQSSAPGDDDHLVEYVKG